MKILIRSLFDLTPGCDFWPQCAVGTHDPEAVLAGDRLGVGKGLRVLVVSFVVSFAVCVRVCACVCVCVVCVWLGVGAQGGGV